MRFNPRSRPYQAILGLDTIRLAMMPFFCYRLTLLSFLPLIQPSFQRRRVVLFLIFLVSIRIRIALNASTLVDALDFLYYGSCRC